MHHVVHAKDISRAAAHVQIPAIDAAMPPVVRRPAKRLCLVHDAAAAGASGLLEAAYELLGRRGDVEDNISVEDDEEQVRISSCGVCAHLFETEAVCSEMASRTAHSSADRWLAAHISTAKVGGLQHGHGKRARE